MAALFYDCVYGSISKPAEKKFMISKQGTVMISKRHQSKHIKLMVQHWYGSQSQWIERISSHSPLLSSHFSLLRDSSDWCIVVSTLHGAYWPFVVAIHCLCYEPLFHFLFHSINSFRQHKFWLFRFCNRHRERIGNKNWNYVLIWAHTIDAKCLAFVFACVYEMRIKYLEHKRNAKNGNLIHFHSDSNKSYYL